MTDPYQAFLARKAVIDPATGLQDVHDLPEAMFGFQRDITAWALRRGRAALFASNPGDVMLTPFLGIGSEVYCAVERGRLGIGIELKPSYFRQAVKNIAALQLDRGRSDLFGEVA